MSKVIAVRWTMRAQPPSERFPRGTPAQKVEIEFDVETYKAFTALRNKLYDGERVLVPPGEERDSILNEMHVLAESSYYLASPRMLPDEEAAARTTDEARTEALAIMEDMESRGYKIPAKAKQMVTDGQTSFLAEPPPAERPSVRLPYKDNDGGNYDDPF